ncbi:MAG: AAA family ATPase [Candidatus Omnitrophica bacterium]|nr:AAA family ATPase [Candidatus Omnitrophota bacterium]
MSELTDFKIDLLDVDVSGDFGEICRLLEDTKDCFFITGSAGSGKSTLLRYFKETSKKNVVVVASTGVSAVDIKGQTIHSFFRFPPKFIQEENIRRVYGKQDVFKEMDTLVLDEVSMVSADIMDAIDSSLRLNRKIDLPFGGVQVIFFGDLFQLPPVVISKELQDYYNYHYGSQYFFSAKIFDKIVLKYIELDKIYRQEDGDFISLLNKVKYDQLTEVDLQLMNKRVTVELPQGENYITLTTTNRVAQQINEYHLNKLHARLFEYESEVSGDFKERQYPADDSLRLKEGAQIMMLRNDSKKRWVNGTLAQIAKLGRNSIKVRIKDDTYDVHMEMWENIAYCYNEEKKKIEGKSIGTFEQYPIKLAWAITIHKSQGKTFDRVAIDLGRKAFAHGQVYVALSRCRTLDGIYLQRPIRSSDIVFDDRIKNFRDKFLKFDLAKPASKHT